MKFTGEITFEVASQIHLEAMKRIDADTGSLSWTESKWQEVWDNKYLFGVVARQFNEKERRAIVGFILVDRKYHDIDNVLKLCVHKDADFFEVGDSLLKQFHGKIVALVRLHNIELCKLFSRNKFKYKHLKDAYSNPADDAIKFEGYLSRNVTV